MKSGVYFNMETLVMFEVNVCDRLQVAIVEAVDGRTGLFEVEWLLNNGLHIQYLGEV